MNEDEWHKWRNQGLGSSDAAVIMKLYPFGKTPYQLWEQRKNKLSIPDNPAMEHGRKYEELALQWFEKKMDCKLIRQVRVENRDNKWIRATLDGIDPDKGILVEVKAPYNLQNHYNTKISDQMPKIYYPQCQHQLIASEGKFDRLQGSYYMSYNFEDEDDSIILENPRSQSYIEELVAEEEKFWDCIIKDIAPELTEKDHISMDNNFGWFMLAGKKQLLRDKRLEIEKEEDEIDEQIKTMANNRSAIGGGLKATKSSVQGGIDYKKAIAEYLRLIKNLHPYIDFPNMNLDFYLKESFTKWVIKPID